MGYEVLKFGTLFMSGCALDIPKNPVFGGDVPSYEAGAILEIGDTVKGKAITWVRSGNMDLYIADRNLLGRISWDDIERQGFVWGKPLEIDGALYCCRLLRMGSSEAGTVRSEWNTALYYAGDTSDDLWHWVGLPSWGQDTTVFGGYRAIQGGESADAWSWQDPGVNSGLVGFRPVLERIREAKGKEVVLDGQTFFVQQAKKAVNNGKDSHCFYPVLLPIAYTSTKRPGVDHSVFAKVDVRSTFRMYTLLQNGVPVLQETKSALEYQPGAELTITDKFFGSEYLITWDIQNGCAHARWGVLKGIPTNTLKELGYTSGS